MKRLLLRVMAALGTLLIVSVILFMVSEVTPGDAAASSLGSSADLDQIAALREAWGLNRPLPQRYAEWISGVFRGDLGVSLPTGRPVTEVIAEPFAYSALLVTLAGTATVILAVAIGVFTGLRPGSRLDRALSAGTVTIVSIPQFVIAGGLVLLLAISLQLLPPVSLVPFGGTPLDQPSILVMPVLALTLPAAAWASRVVRATVIDANAAAHAEAARLAGLPESVVVWRHVLPATVPASAQMFGWLISALFGGTAVIERVFNYPGLSGVLLTAVRNHDSAVLEAVGLLLACLTVAAFLVADMLGVLADPRLRTAPR